MSESWTVWVCDDCMLHHAHGECGSCHDDVHGHDKEPLNLFEGRDFMMGMRYSEHDEGCPNYYPEGADTTQASGMTECDCETNTYSTSPCEGCGSWMHGKRHAMTLWGD